ncbi:hypothetical protein H0E84_12775 [Luteimonas sp. SJ-92]|uniref:Phasin domain-containing protein n=1 Tax=Luteimonas salinisoli TaxID=2752307 RepID=A0A853JF85_9GAMM|nr:hypothetical protein [Luteimonas salinisoli]NZA27257.1 hypothetical protein [Luteimonas salinisoli]
MTDSNLPLALYKANLDLWLRLGELLQDNREQWMQLLAREVRDSLFEAGAEAEQAQRAEGWQSLSMLPGSALWRIAEQQMGDLQALMQTAVGNQMTFANGFQNALAEWQEATAGAIGGAANTQPGGDLLERALQAISALAPGTTEANLAGAAAARGAPSRPAAKKAQAARASGATAAPTRKRAARSAGSAPPGRATAARTAKKAAKKTPSRTTTAKKAAKKRATGKARK